MQNEILEFPSTQNSLTGKLKLNIDWDENFADTNSTEFNKLQIIVRKILLKTLKDEGIDLHIKTVEVSFR